MKRKSGIYKIQFTTKDNIYVYIGKTIDIDRRKKEHFIELNNNNHHNSFMQRIYNKYGKDSMKFSVVLYCEESELNSKEISYIDKYKNEETIICMNMTNGGDGGNTFQYLSKNKLIEIKQKISNNSKGNHRITESGKKRISVANSHPKSKETKENMSKAWTNDRKKDFSKKISGENNPMYNVHRNGKLNPMYGRTNSLSPRYGKHLSEETKLKISESRKLKYSSKDNPMYGKTHSDETKNKISEKNSKIVLCLDNLYNIVEEYPSHTICTKETNSNKYNYISFNKNIEKIEDAKKKDGLIYIYKEDYIHLIKGGDN